MKGELEDGGWWMVDGGSWLGVAACGVATGLLPWNTARQRLSGCRRRREESEEFPCPRPVYSQCGGQGWADVGGEAMEKSQTSDVVSYVMNGAGAPYSWGLSAGGGRGLVAEDDEMGIMPVEAVILSHAMLAAGSSNGIKENSPRLLRRASTSMSYSGNSSGLENTVGVIHSSSLLRTLRSICLAILFAPLLAFADTLPTPADLAAHTVMVPFDQTKPLAGQKPQRFYLDREEFERLWAAAKENRRPAIIEDKDDAHPEAVVQSALYRGTLEEERVVIEAQFTLVTRGRWAKTSLALRQTKDKTEAALREITLDGKPAALNAGELAIETAGNHSVSATYEIPRPKRWTSVAVVLPQARASTLLLTLDSRDGMPFINDAKLVAMLDDSGPQRVVTCVMGSSNELKIERAPRRPLIAAPPPTASAKTVLAVAADLRSRAESTLRYGFPGASRKEVSFSVEPGWDVVGVNANLDRDVAKGKAGDDSTATGVGQGKAKSVAASVTRISIAKQGERNVFTVGFAHEIIDEASLIIGLSPVASEVPKSVPLVLPVATKVDLFAGLVVADGVEANAQPLPGQTRLSDEVVDWKSLGFAQPGHAMHYRLASRTGVPQRGSGSLPVGAATSPQDNATGWQPISPSDSLAITAQQASSGTEARVDYVYQLSEQKVEVSAAIVLTRERGEWTQARVGVPAGMEIQSVVGSQVTAWQQVGDEVFLHFAGTSRSAGERQGQDAHPTSSEVRFVIYLASGAVEAHSTDGKAKAWTLKPFTLPDIEKVKGSAIFAAHKALEAKLVGFTTEHDLREVEPGPLKDVFAIASPIEKQRAIEFERADWTVNVELQSLPVRFSADGVLLAQATDAGVLLSQQLSLSVEQGALRSIKVRLPAYLPEATVTGEQLREMRTSIVGDQREYECSFQAQGGLLGWSALTFTMQLPISDAELSLPSVQIENVERLRRYFIVDNASSREAKTVEASGVEPTPKESLPYVPELLTRPSFYLARTDAVSAAPPATTNNPPSLPPALRLAFKQLQATEGNAAIVTLADITTVLRKDGERWDTVVYSLYNRSLQFLPVVLPDTAELIAVSVSGEPVRADEDHVARDGSKRRVRLIPLIQTRPGQRSMEVRLVYRMRERGTGSLPVPNTDWQPGSHSVSLDDPELVGISAERTVWTASLPKGYVLADSTRDTFGNMEPIAEESRQAELLQGMMSDLGRINRALSLKRSAGAVYGDEEDQALVEAELLKKQIEEQTKLVESRQNGRSIYDEGDDDGQAVKQVEVFKSKLGKDIIDLNVNLKIQSGILSDNRIARPQFNDLKNNQQSKRRSTLNATTAINKIGDGKLLLANGNTWNAQGDTLKNGIKGGWASTENNANAALGLSDNVGVNNDFFAKAAPANNIIVDSSAGVAKSGAGALMISGASTFTGGTVINGGTLTVSAGAVQTMGSLTPQAGAVNLTNQAAALGSGAIVNGSTIGGNAVNFGGVVSNAGGSQTQMNLAATNTYSGATNLTTNSVIVSNGGTTNYNSNARGNANFNNVNVVSGGQINTVSGAVNSIVLNGGTNVTSQTQSPLGDLYGGTLGSGNVTLSSGRGMRFGTSAIEPDSIDGLISAQAASPLAGREDVAKILAERSDGKKPGEVKRAEQMGLPDAPPALLDKPTPNLSLNASSTAIGTSMGVGGSNAATPVPAAPATSSSAILDSFDKASTVADNDSDGTRYLTTQAVNQLRPTGRRSLTVSVPAEGVTYHFRKLKDHAVLALEMRQQADKSKQAQAWTFAVALGLLLGGAGLRKWWGRRSSGE